LLRATKSAPPLAGSAGAILDPARSATVRPSVFEQKEDAMITLQDHIDELRAELRGCLAPRECVEIAAELEAAISALKQQDRAGDTPQPPE
jgi:hypothetical protein